LDGCAGPADHGNDHPAGGFRALQHFGEASAGFHPLSGLLDQRAEFAGIAGLLVGDALGLVVADVGGDVVDVWVCHVLLPPGVD